MAKRRKAKILKYNAIFQKESEGGYSVWIPELPGCTSQGKTFEETQKNIKQAIELYVKEDKEEIKYRSDSKDQFMAPIKVRVYA